MDNLILANQNPKYIAGKGNEKVDRARIVGALVFLCFCASKHRLYDSNGHCNLKAMPHILNELDFWTKFIVCSMFYTL